MIRCDSMSRRWKCELWDCTSCNFISNVILSDLRCEKAGAGLFCNLLLLGNRAKLICGYGGIGRRARLGSSVNRRAGSTPVIRITKTSLMEE